MSIRIINFAEIAAEFEMEPVEALKYFRKKGLRTTFSALDMIGEEHTLAFTAAKMMDVDLLMTVKDRLDRSLAEGGTLQEFKKQLIPELQKAGWWGKRDRVDPKTGEIVEAQLGSASRLETIYRTNLQSAYGSQRWEMIQRNARSAPYLMYDAVDDHRTRREHAQWDNKVFPVGSAFWQDWFPPNGYNCRCSTVQLSADDLEDYGLTVSDPPHIQRTVWRNPRTGERRAVPDGLDPGWDKNPASTRVDAIRKLAEEKYSLLPAEYQVAIRSSQRIAADLIRRFLASLAAALLGMGRDDSDR